MGSIYRRPSDCELTPLSQGSGSVLFENTAVVEMAFVVEVVVDRGMDSGVSWPPECHIVWRFEDRLALG